MIGNRSISASREIVTSCTDLMMVVTGKMNKFLIGAFLKQNLRDLLSIALK